MMKKTDELLLQPLGERVSIQAVEQRDRVSYKEYCKISMETCGGNRFEFRDIEMKYGTDVRDGETLVEAMNRAATFVRGEMETKEGEIRGSAPLPTPETMGDLDELKKQVSDEMDKLNKTNPELAQKALDYIGKNPDTVEIYSMVLKTLKAYNEAGK